MIECRVRSGIVQQCQEEVSPRISLGVQHLSEPRQPTVPLERQIDGFIDRTALCKLEKSPATRTLASVQRSTRRIDDSRPTCAAPPNATGYSNRQVTRCGPIGRDRHQLMSDTCPRHSWVGPPGRGPWHPRGPRLRCRHHSSMGSYCSAMMRSNSTNGLGGTCSLSVTTARWIAAVQRNGAT